MTPLHGIASFDDVGFGARAVSRKTPIYFIYFIFIYLYIYICVNRRSPVAVLAPFR